MDKDAKLHLLNDKFVMIIVGPNQLYGYNEEKYYNDYEINNGILNNIWIESGYIYLYNYKGKNDNREYSYLIRIRDIQEVEITDIGSISVCISFIED